MWGVAESPTRNGGLVMWIGFGPCREIDSQLNFCVDRDSNRQQDWLSVGTYLWHRERGCGGGTDLTAWMMLVSSSSTVVEAAAMTEDTMP